MTTRSRRLDPVHPGEVLLEEFMRPMGISINRLARDLSVPPGRISAIVNGKRAITADTALRLGRYFEVSPETWVGLQADYDLRLAVASDHVGLMGQFPKMGNQSLVDDVVNIAHGDGYHLGLEGAYPLLQPVQPLFG